MVLQPLTIDDLKFLEGREPSLRVCHWGSAGHKFKVYVLTKEGLEEREFSSYTDRSHGTSIFRLTNLPMMVSARTAVFTCRRGELFVRAQLEFGGIRAFDLFRGYLTYDLGMTWPPGFFEGFTDEPGLLRSIAGTNPAAGAEITETVPTNARWLFKGIWITLVTNSTTADRRVRLVIDDGTNILHQIAVEVTQAASLTRYYDFYSVAPRETAFTDGMVESPFPPDLYLFQGWRVRTITTSLQAGDDYAAPRLFVEEWIEE